MGNDIINIDGFEISCYDLNTLIIGSGAASLNAAVRLHSFGITDIAIATDMWGGGTSNNTGSDKQTYYKLSLSGSEPDSVADMARDLFNGRCMHGDIALCEAQGSVQSFMHLVELGVRFPFDKYGSFAGYKTDHDPRSRATSAGPYTSKRMFEALASETVRRGIMIHNHHHCIALLTDREMTKTIGALAINLDEKDFRKAFVLFNATNIVLGTGGPAGIYETSVYPHSQRGSAGMAFLAGAPGQNLGESQFGIASVNFRWNLSGSYQQALPRYISRERDGSDEREFLCEHFPDIKTLTKAIFLKGYQWPFDPRKVKGYGSSTIDLLLENEINRKNRDVFLDFTKNPTGPEGEAFSLQKLDPLVLEYLQKCNALNDKPVERLLSINTPAYELFREHGIDLRNDMLQAAVCAQHNNGGLKGNIWWESDLKHLFPVGEVNGSHGVYRPGGSALNSGQVGSLRAALFISRKYNKAPASVSQLISEAGSKIKSVLRQSEKWIKTENAPDLRQYFTEIRKRMSSSGGIIRNAYRSDEAALLANEMLLSLPEKLGAKDLKSLAECFILMDHCLTHYIYLKAISYYLYNGGRSRGSYVVTDDENNEFNSSLCEFDREVENRIVEVTYRNEFLNFRRAQVKDIPEQDLWFEKVWKEYLEDISPAG